MMTKSGCMEEDFVMQEITDNKSILQKNLSITAPSIPPSVTCFGLVTYRGKVQQLKTGLIFLVDNFQFTVTKAEVTFIKLEFHLQNHISAKL